MATDSVQQIEPYSSLVQAIMMHSAHPWTNPAPPPVHDKNAIKGPQMADVALFVVQMRYWHGISMPDPGQSLEEFFSIVLHDKMELDEFKISVIIAHCKISSLSYETGGNAKIHPDTVSRLNLTKQQMAKFHNIVSFIRIHNNLKRLAHKGTDLLKLITIAEVMARGSIQSVQ